MNLNQHRLETLVKENMICIIFIPTSLLRIDNTVQRGIRATLLNLMSIFCCSSYVNKYDLSR